MTTDVPMACDGPEPDTILSAYERVCRSANGRAVEPLDTFRLDMANESVSCLRGSQAELLQPATVKGSQNVVFLGREQRYLSALRVTGNRNAIFVGPRCEIIASSVSVSGDDCTVFIGALTRMLPGSGIVVQGRGLSVVIGERCWIGERSIVSTSDGHGIYLAGKGTRINPERDVMIGDHVFLGYETRVQKGSVIESEGIVLERSIVSGRIRAHGVYQGIPATLREEGVSWTSRIETGSRNVAEAEDERQIAETMDLLRRAHTAAP